MMNEISKFPVCIRQFLVEMSNYIKQDSEVDGYLKTADSVSIKDGTARINVKSSVVESVANYNKFIKDFEAARVKNRLSCYADTVLHTDPMAFDEIPEEKRYRKDGLLQPNYRMQGLHIEIFLKDLVLDKLVYFFNPDSEMGIADSINLLRNCGLTDAVIMRTLNIPRTSYSRYCKVTDSKMDMKETKTDNGKTILDKAKTKVDTAKTELPALSNS
jgi:hypothetical protein